MSSFMTTFRPRNATKGTTSYQLRQFAEATLGGGSLRKIVKLPEGEDENEWLAVNIVRELGLEAHLNTSFKHYVLFIDEHNLATGKDFWGPLGDLVDSMLRSD
ncbi:hypothetical protein DH86_00001889 [Scytalidium sp. 3C]|nr:hypothetical protein DH86_00001889 [Scytalidium sp. 3C]